MAKAKVSTTRSAARKPRKAVKAGPKGVVKSAARKTAKGVKAGPKKAGTRTAKKQVRVARQPVVGETEMQPEAHPEDRNVGGAGQEADYEANFPQVGTPEWGAMNRKRAELIRKKVRGELSEAERRLYETLQRRSLEALDKAFPRYGQGEG